MQYLVRPIESSFFERIALLVSNLLNSHVR